jgi:general secretion pathway protein C
MKHLLPLINIVLIAAISFLSVDTAYKIFAAQLNRGNWHNPPISKNRPSLNSPEFQTPPLSNYNAIVERDIFQTRKSIDATDEKIIIEKIKPTKKNLKLWGTVVGNDPSRAYVIIEETSKKRRRENQHLYRHGDIVQGAQIKKILREKVILSVNGNNEILRIVDPQSTGNARIGNARRIRNMPDRQERRPVRQRRYLRSSQIQKAVSDIETLMSQANIHPHPDGFKITRIKPSSIFRRMGLRNGDIITAANDQTISSVDDAMNIWQDLTAGGQTSLKINRRGRIRIFDYRIR